MSLRDNVPGTSEHTSIRQCTTGAEKGGGVVCRNEDVIGLRRLRLRRMTFVREQFFLAAVAQNVKRLVRFLSQPTSPTVAATT